MNEFAGPGEIGMIDWAAWQPADDAATGGYSSAAVRKTGVAALTPIGNNAGGGFTMARTLGGDANQVAVPGRRVILAWLSFAFKLNATTDACDFCVSASPCLSGCCPDLACLLN